MTSLDDYKNHLIIETNDKYFGSSVITATSARKVQAVRVKDGKMVWDFPKHIFSKKLEDATVGLVPQPGQLYMIVGHDTLRGAVRVKDIIQGNIYKNAGYSVRGEMVEGNSTCSFSLDDFLINTIPVPSAMQTVRRPVNSRESRRFRTRRRS